MQWAVGEIVKTLDQTGARNNTLIIFTSDHGPHKEIGIEGGDAGPFKGLWKTTNELRFFLHLHTSK